MRILNTPEETHENTEVAEKSRIERANYKNRHSFPSNSVVQSSERAETWEGGEG
jgi:hypothetical protein